MSYHNQIIEVFSKQPELWCADLGFLPETIRTSVSLSHVGDIDIIVANNFSRALIEVKSHPALFQGFLANQLGTYRAYDAMADIFLLSGTANKSLDPLKFTLRPVVVSQKLVYGMQE